MGDALENLIPDSIREKFEEAKEWLMPRDPLVLDLDGDGIETLGARESTALFDLDNDGIKTRLGWLKSDDGMLVIDRNGNGVVDSGAGRVLVAKNSNFPQIQFGIAA